MSDLDQLVKGTTSKNTLAGTPPSDGVMPTGSIDESSLFQDSQATLHSSPPQIYLNLLILEASLRLQWLQLRTRRRQHIFFLALLAFWIVYFGYALFLAPREDGSGVGGSVYWVVEVVEKLCLLGGIVTGVLVWGTGQWERGVRWPRRWAYCTNRGLRVFNCKLVVIKQPWWTELLSMLSILFSHGLLTGTNVNSYRNVDQRLLIDSENANKTGSHYAITSKKGIDIDFDEEDLSAGGDYVKLLLLPKPFSPSFRENWDIYRTEYWEKENERRAILRKAIRDRERRIAKEKGGYLWWIGYRGWNRTRPPENDRANQMVAKYCLADKDRQRFRSASFRSGSHPRNSLLDATSIVEADDRISGGHVRGGSTVSKSSARRKKGSVGKGHKQTANSRTTILEDSSSLIRQNSFTSVSSVDS